MLCLYLVLVTLHMEYKTILSKTYRIGDTKYNIMHKVKVP